MLTYNKSKMGHNDTKNCKMTTHCNKHVSSTHRKMMSFYCTKGKFDYISVGECSFQATKYADSGFCPRMEEPEGTFLLHLHQQKSLVNIRCKTLISRTHQRAMSAEQITGLKFKKRRRLKKGHLDTCSPCMDSGSVTNRPVSTSLSWFQH